MWAGRSDIWKDQTPETSLTATDLTKRPAPKPVRVLVKRFREQQSSYTNPAYKEAEVRREFVEPLFEALGWDVDNRNQYAEAYKDVVAEFSVRIGQSTKAPDYSFRIGGLRRFFVETKKASIDLTRDKDAAFQLRRYGWSAKLGVSVLTNFRQLAVYDCRIPPTAKDDPSIARVELFDLDSYLNDWAEVAQLLSRDSILRGGLDAFTTPGPRKRGILEVDRAFLLQLENWRRQLAADIAKNNPDLDPRALTAVTQLTIDRIVFLRICEDRGIEPYGQLNTLRADTDAYSELFHLFRLADAKYNSGLFHFEKERGRATPVDVLTPGLKVTDGLLRDLTSSLYFPRSPYEFSVLPAEILGQVYEQFLGSHIRVQRDRTVTISQKPDVKKAGGVVYTPPHMVRFINEATIGPLLDGARVSDVAGRRAPRKGDPLRIVDPACEAREPSCWTLTRRYSIGTCPPTNLTILKEKPGADRRS